MKKLFVVISNFFRDILGYEEISIKESVIIDLDTKIFGAVKRNYDKRISHSPSLAISPTFNEDLWEIYILEKIENKYGDIVNNYSYIGYYDCEKTNNGKMIINKNYKEFVEQEIEKCK